MFANIVKKWEPTAIHSLSYITFPGVLLWKIAMDRK